MASGGEHELHRLAGVGELTPAQRAKASLKATLGLRGVRRVKILAGPARGVTMTLDFSGHTPMYLGMSEWELHRFFRESLRGARLVLDVGGHVGYNALMFAANCGGRVLSFEADPAQARILADNVAQNPALADRIEVEAVAIAAADGPGAISLDSVCAREGPPDMVKIDVDGGEADALRGGLETLREHRPHLVVETHSQELERECGALLAECGYRPIVKHNRRLWREHRAGAAHNRWLLARGRANSRAASTA
jgi:precorrin-6B methylase 2